MDEEIVGGTHFCRLNLNPCMLKRNPGLNLIEFHTDLVPGLDRIGPPSDAVRHLGIVLNSRQGLGKRFGLPLASGGPLVESVRDCDRNYGTRLLHFV